MVIWNRKKERDLRVFSASVFKELEKKAADVHVAFKQNGQTLALAESCTGGLLSYCLTIKEGASGFFLGSVVSYSYSAKIEHLGVPSSLLDQEGAVNESVCRLMSQGVREKWGSDWALSVTGVAGPGKMERDPPVGVVFVGLLGPDCDQVEQLLLDQKNRQDIRHQSAIFALDFLCSRIRMGTQKKRGG